MATTSERYHRIKEDRDSLKLVVSIISKDLYQQSRENISNTTPASANLHSSNSLIQDEIKDQESQENTNDWKTVCPSLNETLKTSNSSVSLTYPKQDNKLNVKPHLR